jgi:hypothetical protein
MITRSTLLVGLIAAGAFALSPTAEAQHRHGGGGGTHFQGTRSGSLNRGGGFSRGGGFHRGTGFNRGGSFGRGGHSHHGHYRHHRNSFVFIDPFFDPFYYGYGYGYPYGYGYSTYYSQPYYEEGAYSGGNYSAEVDVQSALADRGYYDGPIDGIIGSGTRRAVRAFQRDNGLPVTGRIDRRLLNALRAS